jgi:hypothetical protein
MNSKKSLLVGTILAERKNNQVVSIEIESGNVSSMVKEGVNSILNSNLSASEISAWLNDSYSCSGFTFRVKESVPAKKDAPIPFRIEVRESKLVASK